MPDRFEALQAGLDHLTAQRPAETAAICQELLAADPANQPALMLLGLAIGAQGDLPRARALLVREAHLRMAGTVCEPGRIAHQIRGICRCLLGPLYGDCLIHNPTDDLLRYCVAEFLVDIHDLPAATDVLIEGLRHHPAWPAGLLLLGIVFADQGRFGTAITQFRKMVALFPEEAAGWANLGAMLKVEGRIDDALKAYDEAIARDPTNARIRVNRTVALLHAGRLREAWPDFESRRELPELRGLQLAEQPMPTLSELGDLTGKTVLVTHEEGFGDTMQFMRYLPLLAARGARVLAWVPQPLERVLRSVDGVADVLTEDCSLPPFDFQCPFVSLPRVFDTSLETIPNNVPYLSADPAQVKAWHSRMPNDGLLVGLVWAGQRRPHLPGFDVVDGRRSTRLATLAPLGDVAGARFVSLQMQSAAGYASPSPTGLHLTDPMPDVTDFADTVAIVANLDVVVSVDTSVVHLAGAMGKPVLLLDRYDNCWRWLSGRLDSPWYPTLRIFRQKQLGEWGPVVSRVAIALRRMVRQHSARRARPCLVQEFADAA